MGVKGRDIGLRAASAFVLAPAAVAATWAARLTETGKRTRSA